MGEDEVTETNEIVNSFYYELQLEHSLISLSKWESKYEKPFLVEEDKTEEESLWYIQAMTLESHTPPEVFAKLTKDNVQEAFDYVNSKQTATWFREFPGSQAGANRQESITAELIYYWMISYKIPFECQYWHLNKLFTLIRVCNQKNAPEKKMGKAEALAQRRMLNEQRKKQYGTGG